MPPTDHWSPELVALLITIGLTVLTFSALATTHKGWLGKILGGIAATAVFLACYNWALPIVEAGSRIWHSINNS
jgi:hypothetical protein